MKSAAGAPPAPREPTAPWRPHPLDVVAVVLAVAGAACALSGLLPRAETTATLHRILPLLLFLGTVIVLAELTAVAGVFDVLASRLAIASRGRWAALFLLCGGLATVTTLVLNLDTTAVLLTPVLLALARGLRVPAGPLAVTTVWLANTASLLLPVSNLTNLLAADRVGLTPLAYAERMALPQLAAVTVTMALLWYGWWRRERPAGGRFVPPAPHVPADPVLHRIALAGCLLFVAGILAGVEIGLASSVALALVLLGFVVRSPATLRAQLVPVRLLLFVVGLFLVVQTLGRHGLDDLVADLVGADGGAAGALRAGGTGALLANAVNNLPAYLAGEAVLPSADHTRLLALLIGTNVGPLAAPWASLATLLWFERCRAAGVAVPVRRFVLTSTLLAVVGTLAAVGALLLVS
ncbi:ArsB/NhaD family transporter [Micromonospora lupini]|uniref:SLC13 family permease n=1 Tax=Micromonospora lupini TaxID=285679 RepID=UPI0031DF72A6